MHGYLYDLEKTLVTKRKELLKIRAEKQKEYDAGKLPDFPSETEGSKKFRLESGANTKGFTG